MKQKTLNILIIDDDEGDRIQLIRTLKKSELFCNYIEKVNLEEAILVCRQMRFDCVIIDYQLPGQNGLEGISILSSNFPDLAIIMSTGQGNEVVATEALKHGASDYIVKKNLSPELLKKSITGAIEKLFLKKQLKEKEARIQYLAHHDTLTETPNRLFFNLTLTRELEQAKRHKRLFAVLFLDLDRFKNINDSFGHGAGDSLLQQVSQRFKSVMRGEDMLARLGGDEFAILISNIDKIEDAELCAQKLTNSLKSSFIIDGKKINITSSIGVATYPISGETIAELMSNADTAMYQAKYAGKNMFKLYTSGTKHQLNQRVYIEIALREAIKNKELYLCYQPIYRLSDTSIMGMEVLLRWNHGTFGELPIDQIISVAEESGLIFSIGDWIINEAFREYNSWKLKDNASIKLALNLSHRQLSSIDWLPRLKQLIENHHIDPRSLIFELTESDMIRDMQIAKETLSLLVKIGAQVFIDDFGMGYSSLKMVQNFPISGLKIDKSCTDDLEDSSSSRNLVKSLFMLAENMGYIVVAEGIETKIQLDLLKSYVDGKGQGYYLSKPLLSDGIVKLLYNSGKT